MSKFYDISNIKVFVVFLFATKRFVGMHMFWECGLKITDLFLSKKIKLDLSVKMPSQVTSRPK